jgi:hypothetical protein
MVANMTETPEMANRIEASPLVVAEREGPRTPSRRFDQNSEAALKFPRLADG